ncbi:MAG: hypothetical protein RR361_06135, partial [Anaerovorax sp.]
DAEQSCKSLSVTLKFLDESGVVYAQLKETNEPIEPGESVTLQFSLPQELLKEGVLCEHFEYVVNQAIA